MHGLPGKDAFLSLNQKLAIDLFYPLSLQSLKYLLSSPLPQKLANSCSSPLIAFTIYYFMDLSLLTFFDLPLSSPSLHLQTRLFWIWFNLLLAVLGLRCHTRTFSAVSLLSGAGVFTAAAPLTAEHRLSVCGPGSVFVLAGSRARGLQWLRCTGLLVAFGTWNLPGPGVESVSPALAGGFLSTAPPGISCTSVVSVFYYFFILVVVFIHRLLKLLCILTFLHECYVVYIF